MKELINNLIQQTGLNNKQFAEAVGTSNSYLSQQKNLKYINIEKLKTWMKAFNINSLFKES